MSNGQFIHVFASGDASHPGTSRILITSVGGAYGSTADVIHEVPSDLIDGTDVYVDYLTIDVVNLTTSPRTLLLWWGTSNFPTYTDVPPRGAPPTTIYIAKPLGGSKSVQATIVAGSSGDLHVGCRVDRFQKAA